MSEESENDLSLDLQFLPEWAQKDSGQNKYAGHAGDDRKRGGQKRPRRERNDRRHDDSKGRGAGRPKGKGGRDDSRDSGKRKSESQGFRGGRGARDSKGNRFQRPQAPQLGLKVDFIPNEQGVESIAKEIKLTGRAYPLFQIALLILDRPSRYTIKLSSQKKSGEKEGQSLFRCKLDETAWLTEEQSVRHALSKHFEDFYETKKTETEGPKGNFTFVAQCGVTEEYLGAPNHHDYQNKLVSFHAERLSRMPFEKFKSRIRILKEEEAIKTWLEQAKWKTQFVSKKAEAEAVFEKREDVEAHFRVKHLPDAVEEVDHLTISGESAKTMHDPKMLAEFLKDQWHKQKHFPMQLSTHLSKIFSGLGLQFFKKDKKVTHVSVARPNFLDIETEPVSDGVKRIMQFIDLTPECTRLQILEQLGVMEPVQAQAKEEKLAEADRTECQKQIISDLYWLIHQGYVLEFSNGFIETAKKPRKKVEENVESKEVAPPQKDRKREEVNEEPSQETASDSGPLPEESSE